VRPVVRVKFAIALEVDVTLVARAAAGRHRPRAT
jgi:hypothetical protein